MKTCITAPEPIEATWGHAMGVLDGHVFGAKLDEKYGILMLVVDHGFALSNGSFRDPSPALLAFIARAEAELLPKKLRSVGEVTVPELKMLAASAYDLNSAEEVVKRWATERKIKLPEAA